MKKERLEHFKEKLMTEKSLLENELNQLGVKDQAGNWSAVPGAHNDGATGDEADEADFIENFDSKTGRIDLLVKKYEQILGALDRIENGTYGICIKSGKPIEEDRLEANPSAETCKAMMNK